MSPPLPVSEFFRLLSAVFVCFLRHCWAGDYAEAWQPRIERSALSLVHCDKKKDILALLTLFTFLAISKARSFLFCFNLWNLCLMWYLTTTGSSISMSAVFTEWFLLYNEISYIISMRFPSPVPKTFSHLFLSIKDLNQHNLAWQWTKWAPVS